MAETPLSPESAASETASVEAPFNASGEGPFAASDGVDADTVADTDATPGADNAAISTQEAAAAIATATATASAADTAAATTADITTAVTTTDGAPWITAAGSPSDGASSADPISTSIDEFAAPSLEPAPPASAWEPEPTAAAEPAGIAATIAVPPLETAAKAEGDGGEWDLLVAKLNAWFNSGELTNQWQKIRGPLKGVAFLFVALLALRLYAIVVGTIDGIPLVSGLLELTGLIVLGHFGLTKMVKTSEREQVLATWKRRWQAFIGQD